MAAWILGAAVAGALSAVAYWLIGWLGIGLLGLMGLNVSTRVGSSAVPMYAKQLKAQDSPSSPEQKMAATAEREKRSRTLYLINTVFIAMTVFGLGLFVLHQLP